MAATKAKPATAEPVKRSATKSPPPPAKRSAAKAANGAAPAKRATKTAPRATKPTRGHEASGVKGAAKGAAEATK